VRDGVNGFLAPPGNAAAFCAAAGRALDRRGGWPTVRAAARATALGLSWDRIVAGFEETVAALLPANHGQGLTIHNHLKPQPAGSLSAPPLA
jgi:hypothetical protein